MIKLCTKHKRNETIRGRVIGHLVNFRTFPLLPVKITEGMGKISESILQVQPWIQPLIYFWWGNRCIGWKRRADEFKIPIWGPNQTTVLRGEWAKLYQILGVHRTIIDAPQVCLDLRYVASIRN